MGVDVKNGFGINVFAKKLIEIVFRYWKQVNLSFRK